MTYKVMHLMKQYGNRFRLLNDIVSNTNDECENSVCYLTGAPDGNNDLEELVTQAVYLELPKKELKWRCKSTVARVTELIDREKIDVLVCHFRRSIPIGYFAAKRSQRKPKVLGVSHGVVGGRVGLSSKILNYFIYRNMARMIGVSQDNTNDLLRLNWGVNESHVTTIYNGIEVDGIEARPTQEKQSGEPVVLAMVSRLSTKKNHSRVIKAIRQVVDKGVAVKLKIIGDGVLRDELEQLVDELDLRSYVSFEGFCSDVQGALEDVDVFMLPSFREGFAIALLEAMLFGKPVITSNRDGMSEALGDENCGVLVNPSDPSDIANAIVQLASLTHEQRVTMGKVARQRVLNNFTADKMGVKYKELYREVLGA